MAAAGRIKLASQLSLTILWVLSKRQMTSAIEVYDLTLRAVEFPRKLVEMCHMNGGKRKGAYPELAHI